TDGAKIRLSLEDRGQTLAALVFLAGHRFRPTVEVWPDVARKHHSASSMSSSSTRLPRCLANSGFASPLACASASCSVGNEATNLSLANLPLTRLNLLTSHSAPRLLTVYETAVFSGVPVGG